MGTAVTARKIVIGHKKSLRRKRSVDYDEQMIGKLIIYILREEDSAQQSRR